MLAKSLDDNKIYEMLSTERLLVCFNLKSSGTDPH